jgi:small subunit ribosomal protein S6
MTMTRRYEALLALDTRGREETIKDSVERIEKLFKAEGAAVEQVQRLEKRDLAYEHAHMKSAYFVNIIFEGAPELVEKLRAKLKLDAEVTLQNYLQLSARRVPTA